jgi:hypothetical protein
LALTLGFVARIFTLALSGLLSINLDAIGYSNVDPGYTGENAPEAAEERGVKFEVAPLPTAK